MVKIFLFVMSFILFISCNPLKEIGDTETKLDEDFFQGRGLQSLKNGLLSFWRLNESGLTENRRDTVGSNDFIWNSGSISSSSGKIGNALECSSMNASNRFDNTSVSNLNFGTSQDFTVSLWAKVNASAGNGILFQLGTGADRIDIQVLSNNEIDLWLNNSSTSPNIPLVSYGQWNHFVFIVDRDFGVSVFKNGNNIYTLSTNSTSKNYSFSSLRACSDNAYMSNPNAAVDSIGIWGRKLTFEEITALYQRNNDLD
jgi:hypothetical protein